MKPGAVTVPIALRDLNNSPIEGATLTCTVSIDGAAFAASTNSATEVGSGDYSLALTAAERGTAYTRIKATDGTYTSLVTVTTDDVMRGTDGANTVEPDNATVQAIAADYAKTGEAAAAAASLGTPLQADDYTAPPTDYATAVALAAAKAVVDTIADTIAALPGAQVGTRIDETSTDSDGDVLGLTTASGEAVGGVRIQAFAVDAAGHIDRSSAIRQTTSRSAVETLEAEKRPVGSWELYLPAGTYTLVATLDGYYDAADGDSEITRTVTVA